MVSRDVSFDQPLERSHLEFAVSVDIVANEGKENPKHLQSVVSCSECSLPTRVGQHRSGHPVSSLNPRLEHLRPIPTRFHHQKCFHIVVAGVIVGIPHHALRLFIREVEIRKMDGKILVFISIRKGIISRAQAEEARPHRLLSLPTSEGRVGSGHRRTGVKTRRTDVRFHLELALAASTCPQALTQQPCSIQFMSRHPPHELLSFPGYRRPPV